MIKYIFCLLLAVSAPAFSLDTKKQDFVDRVKSAYESGNNEDFINLFHQDGLSEEFKDQMLQFWNFQKPSLKDYDLNSIEFQEFTESQRPVIMNGYKISTNLEILGKISIPKKEEPEGMNFGLFHTYGEFNGKYYIVGQKKEAVAEGVEDDKNYMVNIGAFDGAVIDASCEFTFSDGSTESESIKVSSKEIPSMSTVRTIPAQSIKGCEFNNISQIGSFFVGLLESQNMLFEEEATAPEKTKLVYKTK